ncbi:sialate O-acetylesterase [Microbacter margulisiae]|uniref:Sialate O-acetylesterase n=1 Tax=Microbacter margulisiae TaxID=1350067 RepID=A0A7W5H2T4_9PORP|nr:sialate O-acetylesterase [Microbacter margulisiae]MBB3188120.1 sialate O-acetylesterase [Microbacter margulisiae]
MYTKNLCGLLIGVILCCLANPMYALVKLPRLVSNGMVLQRNTPLKIWGWADPQEKVTIRFHGFNRSTVSDANGDWQVTLPSMKAGGPFTMLIKGQNTIELSNILVGDVWLCAGQSNMEHTLGSFYWVYPTVIANAANPNIREFNVPETYNFIGPQKDFPSGNWEEANPKNVYNWSAVAYFFGKYLYAKYKVPVGLINSSLGGSPAEAWVSADALKTPFPRYYAEAQEFKNTALIREIEQKDFQRTKAWYTLLQQKDEGYKGISWYSPSLNTANWDTMAIPGYWAHTSLGMVNGSVWFRRTVDIPASMTGKPAKIILGRMVDADSVFINGEFVGTTGYQYPRRRYDIPAHLLKAGANVIVIRIISNAGEGGFVPDKQYAIVAGNTTVNLVGEWQYHLGAAMPPLMGQTFIRWKPVGLFNAMIAPLLSYRIKGAVWYQGESNTDRPVEYKKLLSTLISDWRAKWDEGNFPFLLVQLPNFMPPKKEPSNSDWALLRESQLDALSLPNTAMAVTIDIGEWNDIHPVDKKDVGKRLALAAEKIAYGDPVIYSGPLYKSMKIEGNKVVISFSHTGEGLMVKGSNEPGCFAVAGQDQHFVWAKAKIENDHVIVWNDTIQHPVAVRYAWADDPVGAKLYNKEGLPASPFRTDHW